MSKPEQLLWGALRHDALGLRFRRSHPAGPYILDFYCSAANLCVEVDGRSHDQRISHDSGRDAYLKALGVRTLRFAAIDVLANWPGVLLAITKALATPSAPAGHLP